MRLFVAIDLSDEIKNYIAETMKQFRNDDFDIKFVKPVNLHLTVKFLGDIHEDSLHDIENRISDILKNVKQFKISLETMGYFGNPNNIRVIWIGIKEGRETIAGIMRELNENLKHIRDETREPSPHLTLGRVKSGRNKDKLLEKIVSFGNRKFGEMDVSSLALKSSELQKEGPSYRDVKLFHMGE